MVYFGGKTDPILSTEESSMETAFSFQITPLDRSLLPQIQGILAKRVELDSRRRLPGLWSVTDKLSAAAHPSQRRQNRLRRTILGLLNWGMGLFLLLPGLMSPDNLWVLLLVGLEAYVVGSFTLWRYRRTLLGALSLIQGALLLFGGLNSEVLRCFLPLGVFGLMLGLAALLSQRREARAPFRREAEDLLRGRNTLPSPEDCRAVFTPSGLLLLCAGPGQDPERQEAPFSSISWVLETQDLLAPIFEDSILLLQKKDLLAGPLEELFALLAEQTALVRAEAL